MSRTDAHVPDDVEIARLPFTAVETKHRHWRVLPLRQVSCLSPEARCFPVAARWASRQPHSRRGSGRIERRSVVRDVLRTATVAANSGLDLDDIAMPVPHRFCLCQTCGD
ncbi:hypothetical protein ACFWGN_11895 [Oerskovia sp. NPDC060338]|uniref:Uncharacterized protein n=1 Tax=Oerskovia enterophila TaxID=43678 RepID=A0ABX2Y161_9CELL|nr:hypothetical protein [Oerskovia enterophila]OCI30273.1 hypothetical protein OERS_30110 [Oerskovia enterophila]